MTPGPWLYADRSGVVLTADGKTVAFVAAANPDSDRNGPILAAAPEMVNELAKCIGALRGVADGMDKVGLTPGTVNSLRAFADDAWRVLSKATGAA